MSKSSRLTAFEILHRISTDGSYSNIALDSALTDIEGDKAFVSALVYGVCERQLTLDYFINKYADKKPKAKVMTVLRLGAYQLLYMDKVPSSAAINESVRLVKEIKQDYYSGLVNAVLRRIDADSEDISGNLSLYYSVPENLINMWIKQYGDETVRSFLTSVNGRPPVYAVPNNLYVDASELEYELMDEGVECETEGELVKARPHSEQNDKSNLLWKDKPIMRHIDLSRLHSSVNLLPWRVLLEDGSPVGSEALVAMANRLEDRVTSTTMIA